MRQIISISPVLQNCIVNPDYVGHTITANTTWTTANTPHNGNILIEGDLVINGGATLTINPGVIVHFGEQSSLIIKPNARLVLKGTLTSQGCGGYTWKGVKVWGSLPSQSQYVINGARAQGRIECQGGSQIENAKTGIELFGPTYTLAGGQLSCSGATIKNCIRGIEFAPYQNFWPFSFPSGQQGQPRNYAGSVSGTVFRTDDDYPHAEPFNAFVYMVGVNSIGLSGCTYYNDRTINGGSLADWGYGVFATDAGFNVQGQGTGPIYPPPITPSSFYGLGYGVYTEKVATNRPYTVQKANFNNCFVGVRNVSVTGGTIIFNNFNLGAIPSTSPTTDAVGVIFETDVAAFNCEENNFQKVAGDATTTIGSVCRNTGIANKAIRRNTYTQLTFGNLANEANAGKVGLGGPRGLYYDCNKNYTTTDKDFNVPDGTIRSKQGIEFVNPNQLTTYGAAGNRFSYTAVDFSNFGAALDYFYKPGGLNEQPLTVQGGVNVVPATSSTANTCPATYCSPPCPETPDIPTKKSEFYGQRGSFLSVKASYDANPTDEKARQMGYYQRGMDETANAVVSYMLYDTIGFNADSLYVWVGNMGSIEGDLWLSTERLGNGNATVATLILNATTTKYLLNAAEQADIDNYKSIVNLLTGKSVYSLDGATLQSVKAYENAGGYAESWARNIATLYGAHYPPRYNKGGGGERSSEGGVVLAEPPTAKLVTAKPNPASDYVDFGISLPADAGAVSIRIFDMTGRLVLYRGGLATVGTFTWETGNSPSGVYFYHVLADGAILHSGKVVLEK